MANMFNAFRVVARFAYRHGFVAMICKGVGLKSHSIGMGLFYLFRYGVHRVGTAWALPTLKTYRVWRMLRGVENIDIVLTLMWGGGSAAYVEGMISRKTTGEWTIVAKPTGVVGRRKR